MKKTASQETSSPELRTRKPLGEILSDDLAALVIWNILFFLTCLPVLTLGPALAALGHCTTLLVRDQFTGEKPAGVYLRAFCSCFFRAFPWGLAAFAASLLFGTGLLFYARLSGENWMFVPLTAISLLGLIFLWGILIHLFPLISEVSRNEPLFRPAANLALSRMGATLRALLILAVFLAAQILYFPAALPITLSIGLVFPALACAFAHVPKTNRL